MPTDEQARRLQRRPQGGAARVAARPSSSLGERLQTAWRQHPLTAALRLQRRLAFCRNLLSVIKSGLPISTVFTPTWRGAMAGREELVRAGERLREGASLVEALGEVQELVDPVTRALLGAGEQSGRLQQILERRIAELEDSRALLFLVLKLALYPSYLLAAVIFVAPLLSLPGAMSAGACTGSLGHVYLTNMLGMLFRAAAGVAVLLSLPLLVAALDAGQAADRLLLRSWLVGPLLRNSYGARLAAGLSAGLGGGLDVAQSVRLAGQATASAHVQSLLPVALNRLTTGGTLVDAIAELGLFDVTTLGQVAIAERTGELEDTFDLVGRELRAAVARRARVVVLVVMGLLGATLLAAAVIKILGVIFGSIGPSLELPLHLDRL